MHIKQKKPTPGESVLRWVATMAADALQNLYEAHRVPETWGTPSVSQHVFRALRQRGFFEAGRELTRRVREVGVPELSTAEKIIALVTGIGLVLFADALLKDEAKPTITRRAARAFSPSARKSAVIIYTLGATLLVAANEGTPTGDGGVGGEENPDESWSAHYPGSETSTDYQAYERPDEADGGREIYNTDVFDDWSSEDDSSPGQS